MKISKTFNREKTAFIFIIIISYYKFLFTSRIEASPFGDDYIDKDHLCFVDIYPYGKGGMYDYRDIRIKPAMYIRWLIMQSQPHARRNVQFIFNTINIKDIKSVDSGVYASVRTAKIPNMNAKKLRDGLVKNDKNLELNLNTALAAVRNTPQYWNKIRSDAFAMDEQLGSAHFFLTLSSNEWTWRRLKVFLRECNKDIYDIDNYTINELFALDPVSVSIFWEKKFRAFFNKVILENNSVLGRILHYFWRREYQMRGTQHIHSKLWAENAPIFGKDSDELVIQYIDKHITCRLPDPVLEPLLYKLVIEFQMHKCSQSCLRVEKRSYSKKKKDIVCRYGFPRPICTETTLNSMEDYTKNNKKMYNLKRCDSEIYINDYNPGILLIWQSNIDIQYINDPSGILNRYFKTYFSN
jgi:hypothetical protein